MDETKISGIQNESELISGNDKRREPSDGDKGDCSGAVFNILDSMLKDSLDRLKSMRSVGCISV